MLADMPLAELRVYRPELTHAPDFDTFWESTLAENAAQPIDATVESLEYPVERVRVMDVRFTGFGAGTTRVAATLLEPTEPYRVATGRFAGQTPTLIIFHGYSGWRGYVSDSLVWALQGFNVLAIDTRGQNGDTPDHQPYPSGSVIGHMSKGIASPKTYYYRYAYMDCVRALTFMRDRFPGAPILLKGKSQGGGLTLAAAALGGQADLVGIMPDVPYLCHFARALEAFGDGPYQELVQYFRIHPERYEESMRTLTYFDGMNLAARINTPALVSVGLLDTICPPSTGFAVFNHLASTTKELAVYPFGEHAGGISAHDEPQFRFARACLVK